MDQGLIPRRYAKALFLAAAEKGTDTPVYDAMRRLADAFGAEPSLDRVMGNPAVRATDKLSLVLTSAAPEGNAEALLSDFVKLLEKNRRIDLLHGIALAFIAEYRSAHSIYSVTVTSAAALPDEEMQRIKALVEKYLPASATAEFSEVIDPALIGGFTVGIDNELLDASVASELKQLRLKLLSH